MKFTTTLFRIALICSIANRYTISAILTCPGQCHCSYEAMNVAVDCSGVELTELPEFDDFEVIRNWVNDYKLIYGTTFINHHYVYFRFTFST